MHDDKRQVVILEGVKALKNYCDSGFIKIAGGTPVERLETMKNVVAAILSRSLEQTKSDPLDDLISHEMANAKAEAAR